MFRILLLTRRIMYLYSFRLFQVYRSVKFYYIVESRTVWPNLWRVINLIHILLILAHWFGCFYYLLSEAEGFQVGIFTVKYNLLFPHFFLLITLGITNEIIEKEKKKGKML